MLNMNTMAMTVFLDMGGHMPPAALDLRPGARGSMRDDAGPRGFGGRAFGTSISGDGPRPAMDEYLCLVISFHEGAAANAGLRGIGTIYQHARPELIRLLARLKSRYCLRIAVIGDGRREAGEYRGSGMGLKLLADYYLKPSPSTMESLGAYGIAHVDYESTRAELASFGLSDY